MPTATNPHTGEKVELVNGKWVPAKRGLMSEITGAMANVNRGLGIGDEMAAGLGTLLDGVQGKGFDFDRRMAQQRGIEDDFAARRPNAAAVSRGVGNAATMAVPAGGTAQAFANSGRVMNVARGATLAGSTAAVNGLLDRGSPGERLTAASEAAINPVNLALGGALGATAGKGLLRNAAAPKPRKPSKVQTLRDHGVNLTPGQAMSEAPIVGGLLKTTENLMQRAPILGPAIKGARARGTESLGRGVALRALAPIGEKLPKDIVPGYDTIRFVDDKIGAVYDRAADLVPMAKLDQQFADDMANVAAQKGDLSEEMAATFDRAMNSRMTRLGTGASGEKIKLIHSELGKLQRKYASQGETIMADMLGDSKRAIMGLIERADPRAAELVRSADEGYAVYKIANKASEASKDGNYAAGQLSTQVKNAGKKRGVNTVGKGEGLLQDLSSAASTVMPDEFGNPGTGDVGGLITLAGLTGANPVAGAATAGGLIAAATPYYMMGRKVLEELPPNAGSADIQRASQMLAQLARNDPKVQALQQELAARSARAVGLLGQSPAGQPTATQ